MLEYKHFDSQQKILEFLRCQRCFPLMFSHHPTENKLRDWERKSDIKLKGKPLIGNKSKKTGKACIAPWATCVTTDSLLELRETRLHKLAKLKILLGSWQRSSQIKALHRYTYSRRFWLVRCCRRESAFTGIARIANKFKLMFSNVQRSKSNS